MVPLVTAPSSDPTTTRGLLRTHRDLRLLLAAGLVTMTGDWMLSVGLVYTVYDVTGSTLASAVALMAAFVPQVVTGLVAGVFVDRWSRARTMVVGNVLMAVGITPLLLVHGADDVWIVYAVLAANAVLDVFVATADSAMLPLIVPGEGRLTANALNGQVGHVARLVGGAVGGVVAATGGLGAVVVVDAASFLLAALLVQLIRTPTKPPREVDADAATGAAAAVRRAAVEWREGASTVRRSRVLKVLLVFSLITAVGEGIMGTLFTPYVKDVLEGNAATLGTVSSAQAIGGILGGFVAAAAGRRWSSRALFGWGAVVFGLDRPGDLRLPRRVRRRVAGRARHGAGRLPRRGDDRRAYDAPAGPQHRRAAGPDLRAALRGVGAVAHGRRGRPRASWASRSGSSRCSRCRAAATCWPA